MARAKKRSFLRNHSLSIVAIALLLLWLSGYFFLDPKTHWGSFFGNSIADWSGSVVVIVGTKFLYEIGSGESRPVHAKGGAVNWRNFLRYHSLLIFLGVTGIGWAIVFSRLDPESKWGQVVGNLVSEWLQMTGLVFLTKRLVEVGSKEGH